MGTETVEFTRFLFDTTFEVEQPKELAEDAPFEEEEERVVEEEEEPAP